MFLRKELKEAIGMKEITHISQEWKRMLGEHTEHQNKIKLAHRTDPELFNKLVKSGVPSEYRWDVWKTLMNVDDFYDTKKYSSLIKKGESFSESDDVLMRQIVCDAERTFSWHPYFDRDIDPTGFNKLKR
jgi:hypothetical protein